MRRKIETHKNCVILDFTYGAEQRRSFLINFREFTIKFFKFLTAQRKINGGTCQVKKAFILRTCHHEPFFQKPKNKWIWYDSIPLKFNYLIDENLKHNLMWQSVAFQFARLKPLSLRWHFGRKVENFFQFSSLNPQINPKNITIASFFSREMRKLD